MTRTARQMVTTLGFSEKIGQLAIGGGGGASFLGAEMGSGADYSAATADIVDQEVKDIVNKAYRRAKDLVQTNVAVLHRTAEILLEKENIDGEQFQNIFLEIQAEMYLKDDSPETSVPFQ